MPTGRKRALLESLPDPKLKAPPIVCDSRGGDPAVAVAQALIQAGQQHVLVLDGGMIGWRAAACTIESGSPALTRIAHMPRPRAGSVPPAEFTTLAKSTPADVLILDVRKAGEAAAGTIKGGVAVPRPRTGRAHGRSAQEQACLDALPDRHRRRDGPSQAQGSRGYNAAFLTNDIEVAKHGSFRITPR